MLDFLGQFVIGVVALHDKCSLVTEGHGCAQDQDHGGQCRMLRACANHTVVAYTCCLQLLTKCQMVGWQNVSNMAESRLQQLQCKLQMPVA